MTVVGVNTDIGYYSVAICWRFVAMTEARCVDSTRSGLFAIV